MEVASMKKDTRNVNSAGRTRRDFAKTCAIIAAAPILSSVGEAQQTSVAETPSPAAEALTEAMRSRYPNRLSRDQLKEVARSLDGRLRAADALKKFELKNSDEPAFVFSADLPQAKDR
jgi:hypothetical protein